MKTNLECLVLGDLNIDHTTWTRPDPDPTISAYKLKNLIENLFEKILPYGAVQCVNGPTRFERNAAPSGLDHFWTTDPSKLSDIHTYHHGSSDHKIILGTRYTKSVVRSPRFVKKRSYKKFETEYYLGLVKALSWWDLYCRVPCLRPGCAAATGASEVLREGARLRICSWPHENSEFVRILVLRVVAFHFLNKIVNMPLS